MRSGKKIGLFLGIVFFVFLFLVVFGNYQAEKNKTENNRITPALIPEAKAPESVPDIEKQSDSKSFETIEKISKKITGSIIELNPKGPEDFDNQKVIKTLNPQKIAEQVINEELANISQVDLGLDNIEINPVKISAGNSAKDFELYFDNFQKILNKNFIIKEIKWGDFTNQDLDILIVAYQKSIKDFYGLETPEKITAIHKKQLLLMSQQEVLFQKIRNVQDSPLEALAALNYRPKLDTQFENLKREITDFIKANSLKI